LFLKKLVFCFNFCNHSLLRKEDYLFSGGDAQLPDQVMVWTWQAHFGKGPKTGLPLSGRDVDVLKIRNIRREM